MLSRRQSEKSMSPSTASGIAAPAVAGGGQHALSRRATSRSLELSRQAQARPKTSASIRLATRNATSALQCWLLPSSEAGASGTQANLLERAVSSISITADVAEEGADGDFLRRVLKSGQLTGLHKACAQGNINAVVSIVKIDSERQGQLGYPGLSVCDVFGRTPLMYAAVADSKPCLDMLLTCGAKRDVRDPNGHAAVHYAAYFGHHRALKFLIEAACDWAPRDIYGRTPLHACISSDTVKCLQLLLKHCRVVRGEVDQMDKENMTALHVAAHCGKTQHLAMLLKAGASPMAVDMEGKTALHWAVTNSDTACVLALHQAYPAIVNMRDIYSETVLHAAAKLGYAHIADTVCSLENCNMDTKCRDDQTALHLATIHCQNTCVGTLLRRGALDACVDSFGLSPLHYAILSGNTDIVRLFCELESLANLPDADGRRPLHWAVMEENPEILTMLLAHPDLEEHINTADMAGMTAAHLAIENNCVDCLSELLNANASASHRTAELESPLFMACETGNSQSLEIILRSGCNPNIGSADGLPCLHAAILGRHAAAVKVLLHHNADPNVYDLEGASALQAAAFHGFLSAVDDVLVNGARVDDPGGCGLTALHLAASNGHDMVAESLLRYGADVNIRLMSEEGFGTTALDAAVQSESEGCATVLRQHGGMTLDEIRVRAATLIQAGARGFLARKNMVWFTVRKEAAVTIQKTVRGFLQYQRFQVIVRRERAAITLQSHWRGYSERCHVHRKVSELNRQERHRHLVALLHQQLTRKWRQDGLTRQPPKAQPPVRTRKQLLKNPPSPVIPPAYDLEPVKSVTAMLQEESMADRQERIAVERRKRLEMALAMRERHADRARQMQQFHDLEKQRLEQKAADKERERYSGIVQASMQRHERGRELLHHSHTVRSTVSAAIAVQRIFRLWRDKASHKPAEQREQRRRVQRENQAAEVIQQVWRHHRRMKNVREAKQLLNQYRAESILRGTEAEMNVARYQRPTLQKRYQSRKLLVSPPPQAQASGTPRAAVPGATGQQERENLRRSQTRGSILSRQSQNKGRDVHRSTSFAVSSGSRHSPPQQQQQTAGIGTTTNKFRSPSVGPRPAATTRSPSTQVLDIMVDSAGNMTRTALEHLPSSPSRIHGATLTRHASHATNVVVPMSETSRRRWSIPSRPILPRIENE